MEEVKRALIFSYNIYVCSQVPCIMVGTQMAKEGIQFSQQNSEAHKCILLVVRS
jgi:hypothetical protein